MNQDIRILRSAHADADMVTQTGLIEIADEDAIVLSKLRLKFRGVTADHLTQDKVRLRRIGFQIWNVL